MAASSAGLTWPAQGRSTRHTAGGILSPDCGPEHVSSPRQTCDLWRPIEQQLWVTIGLFRGQGLGCLSWFFVYCLFFVRGKVLCSPGWPDPGPTPGLTGIAPGLVSQGQGLDPGRCTCCGVDLDLTVMPACPHTASGARADSLEPSGAPGVSGLDLALGVVVPGPRRTPHPRTDPDPLKPTDDTPVPSLSSTVEPR